MPNLLAGTSTAAGLAASGLCWLNEPEQWSINPADDSLTIVPNAATDFFRPLGDIDAPANDNCCLLYAEVTGDFTATTYTKATLCDFGDAAAMTIRAHESQWAKLCLERSPIGDISLVSVVTNPYSDDANSELLETPECYLRLTRKGPNIGMHYSLTGAPSTWRLVRACAIEGLPATVSVGIHAQAPFTAGCSAWFRSFEMSAEPVDNLRSGL